MNGFKKALILMALGAGGTIAAQQYLAAAPGRAEAPRRIEALELPEPQEAPRPTRYGRTVPQDISIRARSLAAEARAHIARTGQAVTNFYFGGNSVTPVDADEHDRSRYTGDIGNIVWSATHD